MGLLRRAPEERISFENPSVSLSDASLIQLFSGGSVTTAGPEVSETTAIGATIAVYRAVSLLSGMCAGLPLKVYRYTGKKPVIVRVLENPGFDRSPYELWETVMTHLLLWGNAYVWKHRNGMGAIEALEPINPARVSPKILTAADSGLERASKQFEIKQANGTSVTVGVDKIMHIPGLSYDGVKGLSPIGVARQSIGISQAADELAGRLYSGGNMMSGILTTDRPLTQTQADGIKARWRDKVQGSRHAHEIAVLDSGMTFQPTSMPPEEAQFLQTRHWQMVEIARMYGIPPYMLGDPQARGTGTSIEANNIGLVSYTLQPWLSRIEQRVTREVVEPSTQFAEFNTDSLVRGVISERYAAYASGIQWGHLTRNEARELENREPIDGLDEPLTPLNMISGKGDENGVMAPGGAIPHAPDTPTKSIEPKPLKGI